MNRLAVLATVAFCLPLAARADDASRHAKAQELITLLHTDRMVSQLTEGLKKRTADAAEHIVGPNPTPEVKTKLEDLEKKVAGEIDTAVGWKTLEPQFVDIYAATYTEDELTSIITFYKSPGGIAFLEKTPTINSQVSKLTQSRMTTLQTEVNQDFEDFRKTAAPAPAAPSSTPPTLGPDTTAPKK